ncbi:hypothetical protein TUM12370_24260 [Salmonella enterica subsp. enterica serovar Choleraesuis]|nr:hypothetical protein TUM12370_24260 [Salmonella enterica subsp. enterica serovar Choleraesuis]
MKKLVILGLTALTLVGCAGQPKLLKETQSGKPEGFYASTTKEKVKDALINYCNGRGLTIYGADNSTVVCGKEQQGGSAVFTQALIGNAYSTTPVSKVRFTIAQINNDVKVWADMWVETQMAMGQVQQMPITSNDAKNTIQQRLDSIRP